MIQLTGVDAWIMICEFYLVGLALGLAWGYFLAGYQFLQKKRKETPKEYTEKILNVTQKT